MFDKVIVFDWHHIGFLLIFGLLSGVINLVMTKRSQLDAWAESQPRIAGLFKIMRGIGLDPWVIAQGFCLFFLGRLPAYVKQDASAITQRFKPPTLPLLMLCMALGLFAADCAGAKPCPLALEADYTAAIVKSCADAGSAENCPAFAALKAEHEAEQLDAGCRVKP